MQLAGFIWIWWHSQIQWQSPSEWQSKWHMNATCTRRQYGSEYKSPFIDCVAGTAIKPVTAECPTWLEGKRSIQPNRHTIYSYSIQIVLPYHSHDCFARGHSRRSPRFRKKINPSVDFGSRNTHGREFQIQLDSQGLAAQLHLWIIYGWLWKCSKKSSSN